VRSWGDPCSISASIMPRSPSCTLHEEAVSVNTIRIPLGHESLPSHSQAVIAKRCESRTNWKRSRESVTFRRTAELNLRGLEQEGRHIQVAASCL